MPENTEAGSASALAADAHDLMALVTLGRKIGLRDGSCPLCSTGQSHNDFEKGTAVAEAMARRLDGEAAHAAELEDARRTAEAKLTDAERTAQASAAERLRAIGVVQAFDHECQALGFGEDVSFDQITTREAELRKTVEAVQNDLRVLDTLRLSGELERAQRSEAEAKHRLARAQERAGCARSAEATALALHQVARRAAGETLDQRLDRVLPLLSELYRRCGHSGLVRHRVLHPRRRKTLS